MNEDMKLYKTIKELEEIVGDQAVVDLHSEKGESIWIESKDMLISRGVYVELIKYLVENDLTCFTTGSSGKVNIVIILRDVVV